MIDDTNQIINHSRFHVRDIHATVRELSPERKQQLLDEIQLRKGTCLLLEQPYNHIDCERIEKLLNGKRPKQEDGDDKGNQI